MVDNKRSQEICKKLNEIAADLRGIALEIGHRIDILTVLNADGKAATTVYTAGYRNDHYYDGCERLSYGQYTVTPEQVVFGEVPIGLEATIEEKKRKREKAQKNK